ncbi:MAG TPA: chromate resistance protein ChrB domain-containing protein [Stellaceae bacterium]|nr:chromate resistance protein ChrB domain-containing protein [Stellaceae bacterium]
MRGTRDTEARSWVTRKRPKIDRIACPWLIRRFIDPEARAPMPPPSARFSAPVFCSARSRSATG